MEEIKELIETDLVNPVDNSLILDILPSEMANSMRSVSSETLSMDEDEIRKFKRITPTVEKLRIAFWNAYTDAVNSEQPVKALEIYKTVCSRLQYQAAIKDPHILTYLMKPPMTLINEQQALLLKSHRDLWEIMDFPVVSEDTRTRKKTINLQLAKLKLEITKFLDERIQGKAVERTLTINKNIDAKSSAQEEKDLQVMIEKEKRKMGL